MADTHVTVSGVYTELEWVLIIARNEKNNLGESSVRQGDDAFNIGYLCKGDMTNVGGTQNIILLKLYCARRRRTEEWTCCSVIFSLNI